MKSHNNRIHEYLAVISSCLQNQYPEQEKKQTKNRRLLSSVVPYVRVGCFTFEPPQTIVLREHAKYRNPNRTKPNKSNQTELNQTRLDQTRPYQTKPNQTKPK